MTRSPGSDVLHHGGGDHDRAGGLAGRKPSSFACIIGFTIASMLCGAAHSLAQIVGSRLLQGMFSAALVPLSQATLLDIHPPERRTEAASLFSLLRNIGAAIGVSVTSAVLARDTQGLHEIIGASVTPSNRALAALGSFNPFTSHGAALLDRVVNQQAEIIAYANGYMLLICTTLPAVLLLLVMRKPQQVAPMGSAPLE